MQLIAPIVMWISDVPSLDDPIWEAVPRSEEDPWRVTQCCVCGAAAKTLRSLPSSRTMLLVVYLTMRHAKQEECFVSTHAIHAVL